VIGVLSKEVGILIGGVIRKTVVIRSNTTF